MEHRETVKVGRGHVRAFRAAVVESQSQRNRLQGQRNRLQRQRNRLQGQRNRLQGQRNRLQGQRDIYNHNRMEIIRARHLPLLIPSP